MRTGERIDIMHFVTPGLMLLSKVTRIGVLASFSLRTGKETLKKSNVLLNQVLFQILTMW